MISGSAKVKKASSRLRPYSRIWLRSSWRKSLILLPRRRSPPLSLSSPCLAAAPPCRRGLLAGIASDASFRLRLRQREVDLLEAGFAHLEPVELLAALDRGLGQLMEDARRLVGLDDDDLAVAAIADLGRGRAADEFLHRAGGDDPPFAQNGDAVGELLHLVQVVRCQEDRLAEAAERADRLPGATPRSSRRRWPPESRRARVSRFSSSPITSITSSTGRGCS